MLDVVAGGKSWNALHICEAHIIVSNLPVLGSTTLPSWLQNLFASCLLARLPPPVTVAAVTHGQSSRMTPVLVRALLPGQGTGLSKTPGGLGGPHLPPKTRLTRCKLSPLLSSFPCSALMWFCRG